MIKYVLSRLRYQDRKIVILLEEYECDENRMKQLHTVPDYNLQASDSGVYSTFT